jgi:hypothetical protein
MKENTEVLLDDSNVVGLEVNSEKSKYMLMSRNQKVRHKRNIKIANRSFEGVAKFKYLGTTFTDQNYMHEVIKSRLNSGNTCYHSVQSLLSFRLLSRNVKVKIYKTKILSVVFYGRETWSVTLSEEHTLKVFENRVLRRIFGPKRDEVTGELWKLHDGELHNLCLSSDQIKENEVGGARERLGRGKKSLQGFGGKARRQVTTWKTVS